MFVLFGYYVKSKTGKNIVTNTGVTTYMTPGFQTPLQVLIEETPSSFSISLNVPYGGGNVPFLRARFAEYLMDHISLEYDQTVAKE